MSGPAAWHIPAIDAILVFLFFTGLVLGIAVVVFNRRVFAPYVRRNYPQLYATLTSDDARMRTGRLVSDVTDDMRNFRAKGDDFGDPELARFRKISRGMVKVMVGCYVGYAIVLLVYAVLTLQRST